MHLHPILAAAAWLAGASALLDEVLRSDRPRTAVSVTGAVGLASIAGWGLWSLLAAPA